MFTKEELAERDTKYKSGCCNAKVTSERDQFFCHGCKHYCSSINVYRPDPEIYG